ncbi:hypothetical protein FSP39_011530 [Pinctada imbricata]|uniref:Uncharacterized protein n=1 Tax=Pinctada imbricata TaxID=66713 RepID=A0AA88XIJ0_PINIB|nr:hypothetical protein FSP39_011530 [Pinctada imbricata]
MTYIGPAFDIMEILIILEEQKIREDKVFTIAIFVVWNVSFLQFTLLLPSDENQEMCKSSKSENDGCCKGKSICDNEVLGLLIHAILMDIPFFVVRMIALVKYGLYDTLFFASKNFVVILSTVVRLCFIYCEKCKSRTRSESERGHDYEMNSSNLTEDKNQVNTGQNNENNVPPPTAEATNIDQSFNLNRENNNGTQQTRGEKFLYRLSQI